MRLRRIFVLLKKELYQGSKNFFFIFAVLGPLLMTLIFQLVFRTGFSVKPEMGIFDKGNSQITTALKNENSIHFNIYGSETALKSAVREGECDLGIVLPEDADRKIAAQEKVKITAYIFGESLVKNRAIISSVFLHQVRKMVDRSSFVEIIPVALGDEKHMPWKERFFPLVVLMAIVMGGFLIPSTSLVEEKQKRTLGAIITTPVSLPEIFLSKGLAGVIVSLVMGIVILLLNHSFSGALGLIIIVMFGGAVMAACISLVCGAFMTDITSLYTLIKSLGIVLYGPAIVYMFPQIPSWVGMVFPTYYLIHPLMEITQNGAGWSDISCHVYILMIINFIFILIVGLISCKVTQQEN